MSSLEQLREHVRKANAAADTATEAIRNHSKELTSLKNILQKRLSEKEIAAAELEAAKASRAAFGGQTGLRERELPAQEAALSLHIREDQVYEGAVRAPPAGWRGDGKFASNAAEADLRDEEVHRAEAKLENAEILMEAAAQSLRKKALAVLDATSSAQAKLKELDKTDSTTSGR